MKSHKVKEFLNGKKMFPLNLQYFADGDGGAGSEGDKDDADGSEPDEEKDKENKDSRIDEKEIKSKGVTEYLRGLGIPGTEDLENIIKTHKENEEKNKTDLEKVKGELEKTIKLLNAERKEKDLAVAQLEALKMGAKIELVEDLVTVALSKVTNDKDVKTVMKEIKKGSTGSVYFGEQEKQDKGRTVTGGRTKKDNNGGGNGNGGKSETIASRLLGGREQKKESKFF